MKLICLALLLPPFSLSAAWQAGAAKADITPPEPVPLAGYGGKTRMSQRVEHPIWLKALALKDDSGATSVLVTADLVGLSDKMITIIAKAAQEKHGIPRERLILNTSHNHSCPVTEDVLWLYYEFTPEETAVKDRYTARVYAKYEEVIGAAIANLAPAELAFEQGLAGVAVNRRRSRGPESRALGGQVDQDVPVITVKSGSDLKAILFGYSCHTTALGGLSINGDYAGFAQLELEKSFPGSIAMFVQNCGGDANPLPRIRGKDKDMEATELARMYGSVLAEGVRQVVAGKMNPLSGPIHAAMGETKLLLQPGIPLEELKQRLPNLTGMPRREFEHFIRQYETLGSPPDRIQYPVQVWRFGADFQFIALTGETVVDYSLKFKAAYGWNSTWVCGYNNDLTSYIPSLRVLKEGGYEGATGMFEYGHRAPYTETVEELITTKVQDLMQQTK
ncbi:neutral/alkaline non-lysosomal ceramidase N-terminal domain-containing protein [Prosthecobacter sp.]|uniref:neutral/alkaline non-lysosomal ceramidase N-terminal domain-containing protein n=1 Tax=Prosthecobacter sp. TaxID=1965333 RepID=UPI003785044D